MAEPDTPPDLIEDCPNCDRQVGPVVRAYITDETSGWFRVCPTCRYVFEKIPPDVLPYNAEDAPEKWTIRPGQPFNLDE